MSSVSEGTGSDTVDSRPGIWDNRPLVPEAYCDGQGFVGTGKPYISYCRCKLCIFLKLMDLAISYKHEFNKSKRRWSNQNMK